MENALGMARKLHEAGCNDMASNLPRTVLAPREGNAHLADGRFHTNVRLCQQRRRDLHFYAERYAGIRNEEQRETYIPAINAAHSDGGGDMRQKDGDKM